MAETEPQQPQPQKVEIPPVLEEQTKGGKVYRAFQKQNPNATTWESHVGSMLGSLGFISLLTATSYGSGGATAASSGLFSGMAAAIGLTGAAGIIGFIATGALAIGMAYAGGWIGQKIGQSRVERENREGKVYRQPSSLNHEAVEQGLAGAFIWKALTAIGVGLGMGALGYMGFAFAQEDNFLNVSKNAIILTTSLAAAAYGSVKGIFSGMRTGKARMEREYHDAELIHHLQTGKGVPVRNLSTGVDSPEVGKAAGILAGVTSSVDPSAIVHGIPGVLGEKTNDFTAANNNFDVANDYQLGKVGGKKQYVDFSYLGDAHPASAQKSSLAERELTKAAAKEKPLSLGA